MTLRALSKFLSRIAGALSLLFTFIALPACCVVEYYAGIKMGMYRFVVLYNTKITRSIFTPELMPFITWGALIILVMTLAFSFRIGVNDLWKAYGLFVIIAGIYIFNARTLRAAPWFMLIILPAGAFWALSVLFSSRN